MEINTWFVLNKPDCSLSKFSVFFPSGKQCIISPFSPSCMSALHLRSYHTCCYPAIHFLTSPASSRAFCFPCPTGCNPGINISFLKLTKTSHPAIIIIYHQLLSGTCSGAIKAAQILFMNKVYYYRCQLI